MVRKRKPENRGLPARCRWIHGAIYYDVKPGTEHMWDDKKLFRLGKTPAEAFRELGKRIEVNHNIKTIGQLLDRYLTEVVPEKAPKTAKDNAVQVVALRKVFGNMSLGALQPHHIYRYHDEKKAKVSAKREIALLSHAFTKAVQWGLLKIHPFKGQVRLKGTKPRDRYVEDWEIAEVMTLTGDSVEVPQAAIMIRQITGMRDGDLLTLRVDKTTGDYVDVTPRKTQNTTGVKLRYENTPELKAAIAMALAARPTQVSEFVICNKRGESYMKEDGTASGWDSLWQRFMKRVLAETKVKDRFTSRDIRAKASSDAKTTKEAQEMLGHSDPEITERVYRRKAKIITPLKR